MSNVLRGVGILDVCSLQSCVPVKCNCSFTTGNITNVMDAGYIVVVLPVFQRHWLSPSSRQFEGL
jgi:hypothetical protein